MFSISFATNSMWALIVVFVLTLNVGAQLTSRPKPGTIEEPVSQEFNEKALELIEDYNANFSQLERFGCAIYLEETTEKFGEGIGHTQQWFLHLEDRKEKIRRTDQATRKLSNSGIDGAPIWIMRYFATIASPDSVVQVNKNGQSISNVAIEREVLSGDPEKAKEFVAQDELNAINTPFAGFHHLLGQGKTPSPIWKGNAEYPRVFIDKFRVVGFAENAKYSMVRFLLIDGFYANTVAIDVWFSKAHGNMPTKSSLSFNGTSPKVRGVQWTVETKWDGFDSKGNRLERKTAGQKCIWLPMEIRSENITMPLDKPTSKHAYEAKLHWAIEAQLSEFAFASSSDKFLTTLELKDAILSAGE